MATALDERTSQDYDVQTADLILAYFVQHSRRNWMQAIRDTFPDDATIYDNTVQRVQEALDLLEFDRPHGVYVGPAVVPQDLVDDGEAAAAAIRGLKSNLRLHQVGRGRGRLLIILDATPLSGSAETPAGGDDRGSAASVPAADDGESLPAAQLDRPTTVGAETPPASSVADVNASLLSVRNRFLEVEAENRALKALVEDLQIQVVTLNHRNEELYNRLLAPVSAISSSATDDGWADALPSAS